MRVGKKTTVERAGAAIRSARSRLSGMIPLPADLRLGLALGGGGVRGLAHIPVLEALDQAGIRPAVISGTSMGAIIGALYASGLSGREIRSLVRRHVVLRRDKWRDILAKRQDLLKWFGAISLRPLRGGLVNPQAVLAHLFGPVAGADFADLAIPLRVVAADYWSGETVVLADGLVLPAIQASMAVPGVFPPVRHNGRLLVDGGVVNLVPYDLLLADCDVVIAVDVSGRRTPGKQQVPRAVDAVLATFEILQSAALQERLRHRPPHLLLQPELQNIRIFDFHRVERVLQQAAPTARVLRSWLTDRFVPGRQPPEAD